MATATVETQVQVHMTLTQAEATWLRAVVQNPPPNVTPEGEREYDSKMRRAFYDALAVALRHA